MHFNIARPLNGIGGILVLNWPHINMATVDHFFTVKTPYFIKSLWALNLTGVAQLTHILEFVLSATGLIFNHLGLKKVLCVPVFIKSKVSDLIATLCAEVNVLYFFRTPVSTESTGAELTDLLNHFWRNCYVPIYAVFGWNLKIITTHVFFNSFRSYFTHTFDPLRNTYGNLKNNIWGPNLSFAAGPELIAYALGVVTALYLSYKNTLNVPTAEKLSIVLKEPNAAEKVLKVSPVKLFKQTCFYLTGFLLFNSFGHLAILIIKGFFVTHVSAVFYMPVIAYAAYVFAPLNLCARGRKMAEELKTGATGYLTDLKIFINRNYFNLFYVYGVFMLILALHDVVLFNFKILAYLCFKIYVHTCGCLNPSAARNIYLSLFFDIGEISYYGLQGALTYFFLYHFFRVLHHIKTTENGETGKKEFLWSEFLWKLPLSVIIFGAYWYFYQIRYLSHAGHINHPHLTKRPDVCALPFRISLFLSLLVAGIAVRTLVRSLIAWSVQALIHLRYTNNFEDARSEKDTRRLKTKLYYYVSNLLCYGSTFYLFHGFSLKAEELWAGDFFTVLKKFSLNYCVIVMIYCLTLATTKTPVV